MITVCLLAGAAYWVGGWEWCVVFLAAVALEWRRLRDPASVLALAGVSFLWLGAYAATGDRRMFFPFTIQLAAQLACWGREESWTRAVVAAAWLVGVFSGLRLWQKATLIVLFVELVFAAIVLGVALAITGRRPGWRVAVAAVASVLAFGTLFLA